MLEVGDWNILELTLVLCCSANCLARSVRFLVKCMKFGVYLELVCKTVDKLLSLHSSVSSSRLYLQPLTSNI
jgi:hypothetical protein